MDHLLVKGQDTFIKFMDLPMDVKGFVVFNDDVYTIIINHKLSNFMTVKVLKHEIEHIIKNHMSSEEAINDIENSI